MFRSHSSYLTLTPCCLGIFAIVYSKQCCLQTNKYDHAHLVMDIHIISKFDDYMLFFFVFEFCEFNLKKKMMMNNFP